MPHDAAEPDLTDVRRQDRAVTDLAWMRAFLHQAPFGVLGTADGSQPLLHASTFAFDEAADAIYLHTASVGRTRSTIEANPRVCFMVVEMGRLLPAETAMHFSVEYASVMVFGRAEVVADETEARRALQMLLDKYFPQVKPGRDYRATTPDELALTAVFRICIEQWSAKQKREADDFPGAFAFGQPAF